MPDPEMQPAKSTSAPRTGGGSGAKAIATVMVVNADITFSGDGATATIDVDQATIDQSATNVAVWWNGTRVASKALTDPALNAIQVNCTASNNLQIVATYSSGGQDTYTKNNIPVSAGQTVGVSLNRL
jgi:hypothetical protein